MRKTESLLGRPKAIRDYPLLINLNSDKHTSAQRMRDKMGPLFIFMIVATALVVGGEVFLAGAARANSTAEATQCVKVGEPLYPYPRIVPLQSFVSGTQGSYSVSVDQSSLIVTVRNTNGGGIGSSQAPVLYLPIINC